MASVKKNSSKNHIEAGPLIIPDSFEGYGLNYFNVPLHYRDDLKSVFIPYGLVQDRIEALASRIFDDLRMDESERLVCLCVLKGGYRFFSDLVSKIQNENRRRNDRSLPMSLEFIRTRSYINDQPSDQLEIIGFSDLTKLKNKHLLIVEDIIDTGATMFKLKKQLEQYQPKTIHVASLFTKRRADQKGVFKPDYCGFEIPAHFIVGYALDLNEYFRDLEHVCVLKESAFTKYKTTDGNKTKQNNSQVSSQLQ